MKGVALVLGALLLLGGGAGAGIRYVPVDLAFLDSISGAKEFLASSTALYAGGGAAGLGLILFIIGLLPGGKKPKPEKTDKAPPPAPQRAEARKAAPRPEPKPEPKPEPELGPKPAAPVKAAPVKAAPVKAAPVKAAPVKAAPVKAAPPAHKPVASSSPPQAAARTAPASLASGRPSAEGPTWTQDPRLANRRRVSDLVTINDALKAYREKHGKYPGAETLGGYLDRGKGWIPGLAPAFLPELPRDPAQSDDKNGPQYLYVSDGSNYKLIVKGVSLVGGTNVEVLGVRMDPSRQNTAQNAAFGFWTQGFEQKQ